MSILCHQVSYDVTFFLERGAILMLPVNIRDKYSYVYEWAQAVRRKINFKQDIQNQQEVSIFHIYHCNISNKNIQIVQSCMFQMHNSSALPT